MPINESLEKTKPLDPLLRCTLHVISRKMLRASKCRSLASNAPLSCESVSDVRSGDKQAQAILRVHQRISDKAVASAEGVRAFRGLLKSASVWLHDGWALQVLQRVSVSSLQATISVSTVTTEHMR